MSAAEVMTLVGGLGLFLLGMNLMSDGIEKAAGAKLRSILEIFTKNRFIGMIVGVVFTAIIQSSSACTAMVVSFVNSGLMNLYQAAGVIFGANIGTTVTSQLVSFNLSAYAPVFILVGVLVTMFVKKNKTFQEFGNVILGFGVLFMGISTMSSAMQSMKESESVINFFAGLRNPLLAVLVGTVVTAVIQSSSVTVSILLLLTQQGLMPDVSICLYVILGCNIGACATALIASLTGKKDAKRAAMIHLLFNIIGTIIMFIIFRLWSDSVVSFIKSISANDGRFIANAHTAIKIFQVVILLPFLSLIVKLTYLVVPGKDQKIGYKEPFQLKYIGEKVLFNPSTAVVDGIKELERMASLASDNLNRAMNALITLDPDDINEVYEMEKNINFMNKAITSYLVKINQSTLPIEDLKGIGALFHVANDIERIGDHAQSIVELAERRKELGVDFSKEAQAELNDMMGIVNTLIDKAIKYMLSGNNDQILDELYALEENVDGKETELQQHHIDRLTKQECTAEAGMIFSDVVSSLERVADHAINVAKYILHVEKEEA